MKQKGDRLVVWLGDERVGDLLRTPHNEIRFIRRESAASLTVAPDGAAEHWTPTFTRAWFDGLLNWSFGKGPTSRIGRARAAHTQ